MKLLFSIIIVIFWILTKIGDGTLWFIEKILKIIDAVFFLIVHLFLILLKLPVILIRFLWLLSKLNPLPLLKTFKFHLPSLPKVQLKRALPSPALPAGKRRIRRPAKPRVIFPPPWFWKARYFIFGFLIAFLFLFLPTLFYFWLKELPNPHLLTSRQIPQTTKIYDRQGKLLYEIYAEQNRTLVPLSEIPDSLKKATIAIEDKDFYNHQGFNLLAIARAVRENLLHQNIQGGSTLTQQLVKSALLTPEVTLQRKIKEIFLAFWTEKIYSKNQILEMYFNQVPYGGTAWGVEAAAQTYFGKHVKDLTLSESALLAGLPAAPTTYSPFGAHPELANERQKEVLRRMTEEGFITAKEADETKNQELTFAPQKTNIRAPHFVMYVKESLEKKYGGGFVERGGLEVKTSLDLDIQEMAQEIVSSEIKNLEGLLVSNGATLITNPKTGEILAMVGSRDYFDLTRDGNVNVTLSLRQPGSAIKVVNYAAALQENFTASTILDDSPITYQIAGSPPYSPVNYDGRFHGKVPLRYALANSYNVPAVKTLAKIGVLKMIEQGRKMGITTWMDSSRFGLSLTLGGGDVTMLDMTKVYGTLANGGKKTELNPILEVKDFRGEVLEKTEPQEISVLPAGVAFILTDILADNSARSAAFGPNSSLVIPGHTVAVKTGTTNDKRDNWTIGYTPSFLVAVWVGNNDNSPMHTTLTSGVTGAAPIWNKIMENLLQNKPNESFSKPGDIVEARICPSWGRNRDYFLKGTEPKEVTCPQLSPAPERT